MGRKHVVAMVAAQGEITQVERKENGYFGLKWNDKVYRGLEQKPKFPKRPGKIFKVGLGKITEAGDTR